MKKILLIDADSTIPNIPLMKISTWYKNKGDLVNIIKLNISYYPNKKKEIYFVPAGFDKYYCSVIFEGTLDYINTNGQNVKFGGTGFDLKTKLPDFVDAQECDYTLYPENDTSYGFITRGCIRNCYFCKVPKKEGKIHFYNTIDSIVKHKKVKFLDNNILAYEKHIDVLKELTEKKIHCQFNQGLDIRLLTEENSFWLSKLKYLGEYIFAFDNIKSRKIIEEKRTLLSWMKHWRSKYFVYIHPNMTLKETVERINILHEWKALPYIMRDISCWSSSNHTFFTDICSWCNQPNLFKNMPFLEFLEKRSKNKERIKDSYEKWNLNGGF